MKELARRSFELFRSYPVLWAPVLIASLIDLGLNRLEGMEVHWAVSLFSTQRSILGGLVPVDPVRAHYRALWVTYPLGLLKLVITVLLFVVALMLTARFVQALREDRRPDARSALRSLLPHRRGILMLCLRYMLLLGAMGLLTGGLFVYIISPYKAEIAATWWFFIVLAVLEVFVVAWFVSPAALRLLCAPEHVTVSLDTRAIGAVFYALGSALQLLLLRLLQYQEAKSQIENAWEWNGVQVLNTLLPAMSMAWCFVALALLARGLVLGESIELGKSITGGIAWATTQVKKAREWHARTREEDLDALYNRGEEPAESTAEESSSNPPPAC